jgi:hypothetical protein
MANLTDELRRVYDEAFAASINDNPEDAGIAAVAIHVARLQQQADYGGLLVAVKRSAPLVTGKEE